MDQRHDRENDRLLIDAPKRRWQPPRFLPRQPIAGKARHETAANDRDQQHDCRQGSPFGRLGPTSGMGFEVEADVGRGQRRHDADDCEVPPVPSGDDLARRQRGERRQERDVDRRRLPQLSDAENITTSRPATHREISSRGQPRTGSRPGQFGVAVNRKPTTAAAT